MTKTAEQLQAYNDRQAAKKAQSVVAAQESVPVTETAILNEAEKTSDALSKDDQIKLKAADTKEARQAEEKAEQALLDEQTALAKQEAEDEKKRNDALAILGRNASETAQNVSQAAKPFMNWLANQPTPGGLLTIFLILMFFLLAVAPVNKNGDTRLKLIWLTLRGMTHLIWEDNLEASFIKGVGLQPKLNTGSFPGMSDFFHPGSGSNSTGTPAPAPDPGTGKKLPLDTPKPAGGAPADFPIDMFSIFGLTE